MGKSTMDEVRKEVERLLAELREHEGPAPVTRRGHARKYPWGRKQRFTPEEVAEALLANRGCRSAAAKALGAGASVIDGYFEMYPVLKKIAQVALRSMMDTCVNTMYTRAEAGDVRAAHVLFNLLAKRADHPVYPYEKPGGATTTINTLVVAPGINPRAIAGLEPPPGLPAPQPPAQDAEFTPIPAPEVGDGG